jgi:phosphopantothenoylcysteine decarboxylase/phosphopantothenate--cysteine ligase
MNTRMYLHPATADNLALLRARGVQVIEPASGLLADGEVGVGRLADPAEIAEAVDARLRASGSLAGRRVVVSAGGTREPIDPVRFIGNRSTGRMGAAIAAAAIDRGARVTIVAANVEVPMPAGAAVIAVESTADLRTALLDVLRARDGAAGPDALIMAAAVADFRPTGTAARKLERGEGLRLDLEPTPDILAEIATMTRDELRPRPILVGFAAETGSLDRAADKLRRKGVDVLVANDVAEPGSGFGTDTNRVAILDADGARDDLPLLSKREVADRVLDRVARALDARDARAQTAAEPVPHRERA